MKIAGGALAFLLAGLLSRGTSGGDEGDTITFANIVLDHGWGALIDGTSASWAAHRLLWVLEKLSLDNFWHLVLPASLYRDHVFYPALMVLDGPLLMFAAVAVCMHHLRYRGVQTGMALLSAAALFFSSAAISFFAGGVIECQMILYVVIIAALLDRPASPSGAGMAGLIAVAALLVFCKVYALAFLVVLALLLPSPDRFLYLAAILALTLAWLGLVAFIGGHTNGMAGFYLDMVAVPDMLAPLSRLAATFLSFPYGLIWCYPLLFLAALSRNHAVLIVKTAAIFAMAVFFSFFEYWHGGGAVAGPRYLVPFLFILFPEVAQGLQILAARRRSILPAIPLLAALFLPSLEYRNSLFSRWLNLPNFAQIPDNDPGLQPGIFAWRVALADADPNSVFRPSRQLPYTIPARQMFPMTGLSRIIYVMHSPGSGGDARLHAVQAWLGKRGLYSPRPWQLLRALLVALFLGTLSWTAWRKYQETRPTLT